MPDDCCTAAAKSHRQLTVVAPGSSLRAPRKASSQQSVGLPKRGQRNISGLETLKQMIDSPARYYISFGSNTDMSGGVCCVVALQKFTVHDGTNLDLYAYIPF
ncbi:hypothetical protein Y032_0713g1744 [Ancylostoma ceylanicum]|uniref:Uncharacterized protein n=1 Tax=Ancylostoma ceylanicum TaxID=53326 RepID=A0A016WHK7_9BILA|nr:hypothetical protein Y032_0713g1744 [Ancylostoma ceylanicum]